MVEIDLVMVCGVEAHGDIPSGIIRWVEIHGSFGTCKVRVEEFKKLQNGQYISPQKLENIYIHTPMISQICIDVNPGSDFLVAIVSLVTD